MLKLREVEVGYNKTKLIENINLDIEYGKLYILTGENGTGKTTLLKLLSGCISSLGGEIEVDNIKIGYLPFNPQYPCFMNSYKYLAMFGRAYGKDYLEYAKRYELDNILIHKLSKGNLIKLGLIQLLLCDFDLYLLDEANDGLDLESKKKLKSDIKELLNNNKTVIISTHSPALYRDLNPIKFNIKDNRLYEKKKK
jgi:ABC-2 type transport system ATP-binding protein/sodium transport system ATP-binding protein